MQKKVIKTVTFGTEQKSASHLGFGGAPAGLKNYLGHYDPEAKERDSVVDAIAYAARNGITYFDTAPGYGSGRSEEIFGEGLAGVPREDYVLATKCGWQSYDEIMRSTEQSLSRLRCDYLDVVQMHGSSWTPQQADVILSRGGALSALEALKEQGVIRNVGFTSEDNNEAVYRFIDSERFDVAQLCYNFIYQHPYDPTRPYGSLLYAKEAGMSTVSMRATTSGIFQRFMRTIRPEDDYNYTPHLIHFALSNPHIDVVLVGMRTVDEVEKNLKLAQQPPMDIDDIHERYLK